MFEALALKATDVAARDEALRQRLRALDDAERLAYHRAYERRLKDPDTYAVLNWLMLAGLHHFYLGKLVRGAVNLVVMVAGFALLAFAPVIGGLMILAILVVELPALFRSQVIVADHNVRAGEDTLEELGLS